jgi:hypothetical protein
MLIRTKCAIVTTVHLPEHIEDTMTRSVSHTFLVATSAPLRDAVAQHARSEPRCVAYIESSSYQSPRQELVATRFEFWIAFYFAAFQTN